MTSAKVVHVMSSNIVKLPFSILAVSSYEEDCPPEGLMEQSGLAKGWHTERFCIFPQSVILAFNFGKCRVRKIQLLIHEFKIPKRLEFFAGIAVSTADQPDIEFHRIGFTDLSDNSKNSYRSRELKSLHVDFQATHIKISLQKNYINILNLYNQAGILGITLLGEVMDTDYLIRTMSERNGLHYGLNTNHNIDGVIKGFINQDAIDRKIPFLNDLSFDFHQDVKMIRFITAIADAKSEAVRLENYGIAKALKIVQNNAKAASTRIVKIQQEKEKYILVEDYDQAQRCKTEIERIKLSLIDQLESFGLHIDHNGVIYSDSPDRKDSAVNLTKSSLNSKSESLNSGYTKSMQSISNISSNAIYQGVGKTIDIDSKIETHEATENIMESGENLKANEITSQPMGVEVIPHGGDDIADSSLLQASKKPIITRNGSLMLPALQKKFGEASSDLAETKIEDPVTIKSPHEASRKQIITRSGSPLLPAQRKKFEEGKLDVEENIIEIRKPTLSRSGSPMLPAQQKLLSNTEKEVFEANDKKTNVLSESKKNIPPNAPKDLPEAESLSGIQLDKFGPSIDIFELFVVQNILSINFKCREYGLAEISKKLNDIRKGSDFDLLSICKATVLLVGHCLDDSREKSSLLTLGVLNQLLETTNQDSGKDTSIFNLFTTLINALITKTGDTNPRIKSSSSDILKKILQLYEKPPNCILPELLKPFERRKGAIINPKILKSRLEILNYAISEYGMSDRFGTTSIMSFVSPFVDNTNNDVRDLSYSIVAQVCIAEGESYTATFLNSLRDAQKEILKKKIELLGGTKAMGKSKKSIKSKGATENAAISKAKSKDTATATATASVKSSESSKSASKKDNKPIQMDETKEVKEKAAKPSKSDKSKKTSFADEKVVDQGDKKTKKKSTVAEEQCLFCEKSVEMRSEDSLEQHYQNDCPYLVRCPQCEQIVEIVLLQNHMYGSCELAPSDPKSCDRCHLLIPLVDFISHRSKKKCKAWNIDHDPSICGFCKKSIMGKSGWKVHVLNDKKCMVKRNSKTKKSK